MDPYSPFGAPDSEILPQRMNSLYPPQLPQGHQQPQQFATVQQRDHQYQQAVKSAIQSQPGASVMAPFSQHQGGPGQGGMNGPGGPATMGAPGGPGGMNVPGGMGGQGGGPGGMGVPGGPGMGGTPGMNGPGGQRPMMRQRPMNIPMGGMNMVGSMRPGMQPRMGMTQNGMGPNLGPGGMLNGQGGMPGLGAQGGMSGQGNMPLAGQGNMGGLAGQGGMPGMPNLNGPGGMSSMGNGPGGMSMGGGSGMPGLSAQGGMSGLASQAGMSGLGPQNMGSQGGGMSGMGGVMSMTGGGGGMSHLAGGGGMGAQQGGMGMGGQGGLGNGPGAMGSGNGGPNGMGNPGGMGAMSSMGLNGIGASGAPGMSGGANGLPGANGMPGPNARQWSLDRPYPDDITKRPTSAQLDDFGLPGTGQHGIGGAHPGGPQHGGPQHGGPQHGGPQHGPQHGQQGAGGPQHGVGGPGQHGIGPQHGIGAPQQQPPPGQHAGSPVNGLPAHPQHHPVPTHMGQAPPGHMGQAGTPRMNTTPGHAGGPPHLGNAPSPHHMNGSPAHHQGHPHQPPHHLVDSPAHMGSPRHMASSSPAPGPHPPRSGAPTPVPPRGTSADPMMGMRPDGLGRPDGLRLGEPSMMRMSDGMMMRGPDGQARPGNDMMMMRDNRMIRDGMLPMERAPSADGMPRPGVRPEIGRLGPDGTLVRGPGPMQYGQPPPYGAQGGGFGQPAPPGYVLHQTPAQQHQNMQMRNGGGGAVQRAGSVDEMPILTSQMNLPDEMDMVSAPGPGRRQSMPPQMVMMNGGGPGPRPGGPGPGGPGMVMAQRRPTISQPRPFPLGLGIVRLLQMSQEMSEPQPKSLDQWIKFRNEYFLPSGRISMTIFQGVEGRKYDVSPELIARFFLTFFESGVSKMSLGLTGAKETSDESMGNLDSVIETLQGVWRYELSNGWVVEHTGPLKIYMTVDVEPRPGEPQQFKPKVQEITFTAPVSSYLFRTEQLEGTRISGPAPMTPRISPGLAARKTEGGVEDLSGNVGREEEMVVYENARFPPKPFQKFGFPENVWRMLAMSACVHELFPVMELAHETQSGPLAALESYAEMDRDARMQVGLHNFLPDDLGGHQFPNFASEFTNPSSMLNSSPALTHPHPGMHSHHGSIGTAGRPTPTPPLPRPPNRNGQPLAGSGDLPPVPPLTVAGPQPGMIMQQSPSLTHTLPPGHQPNGPAGMKRKQQQAPEPGPDGGGPSGAGSQARNAAGNRGAKPPPPAGSRKRAKTNVPSGSI